MKIANILATAQALSDLDLLARLDHLAGQERQASAELVAHLAALDARPSLFAAKGYSSLFAYCTEVLHLSEDATCNRIDVARVCRKFPEVLEGLATGQLNLTSVRAIGRHLTPENCKDVLARAAGLRKRDIEVLVAELAPRPDAATMVRRVPTPAVPSASVPLTSRTAETPQSEASRHAGLAPNPRPVIQPTAPQRYRVQFTVGQETHDMLRRLQDLLRREIPSGDPAAIVDRAFRVLLAEVEKAKCGAAAAPRPSTSIRSGTDRPAAKPSRYIPRAVAREVCRRDGDQCAFVSKDGHPCRERVFLEKHHVVTYAEGGPATVDNISLRCRRHNQYEAELIFGPREAPPDRGLPL
jgi:hypothetical protein